MILAFLLIIICDLLIRSAIVGELDDTRVNKIFKAWNVSEIAAIILSVLSPILGFIGFIGFCFYYKDIFKNLLYINNNFSKIKLLIALILLVIIILI